MKKLLSGVFALLCLQGIVPSVHGQTANPAPSEAQSADGKRVREFQGDDLRQVFRLLARQAKISLVIDEAIKGNVDMRLENASAMDAIEALARQFKLTMSKDEKEIYYLTPPDAAEATLDLLAKPETAARIAAFKHNLHDALVKEGFSAEEATQAMNESDLSTAISIISKKTDALDAK